jgi:hypothetical protein
MPEAFEKKLPAGAPRCQMTIFANFCKRVQTTSEKWSFATEVEFD